MSGGSTMLPRILARELAHRNPRSTCCAPPSRRAPAGRCMCWRSRSMASDACSRASSSLECACCVHLWACGSGLRQRVWAAQVFGVPPWLHLGSPAWRLSRLGRRRLLLHDFGLRDHGFGLHDYRRRRGLDLGTGFGSSTGGASAGGFQSSTCTASGGRFCQRTPKTRTSEQQQRASPPPARPTRPCPGRRAPRRSTAAAAVIAGCGLHLQTDALHTLRAQVVHDLQHRFIAHVLVAGHQHRNLGILEDLAGTRRASPAGR